MRRLKDFYNDVVKDVLHPVSLYAYLFTVGVLFLFAFLIHLSGCAQMKKCEMLEHDTMYASGNHAVYSVKVMAGGRTTMQDLYDSIDEGWWGCRNDFPILFTPDPEWIKK